VIDAVDAVHRETGLEVACSLGLLAAEQAARLAAAGVRRYNHNLEACRAIFPQICTTHSYDDRVETARLATDAGMELCCGGILGMGETLEQRVDFAFELAELEPCEVPINLLDPRPGTPLGDRPTLSPREALQAIALFRLVLPAAWLRLAGGRERVLGELQAMGLLAGANALIVGNYLTTTGRPADADVALLDALGMPIADGPDEGRFVVDGDGAHARPARGRSIPVRVE
jgi:biotin synthase